MAVLSTICLVGYVVLFIVFAWAMKEVHFIHRAKHCKHTCFLCEYANECHGCDIDSANTKNK